MTKATLTKEDGFLVFPWVARCGLCHWTRRFFFTGPLGERLDTVRSHLFHTHGITRATDEVQAPLTHPANLGARLEYFEFQTSNQSQEAEQ